MSNSVYTICKYHKVGSAITKSVLLCMADFASDDGSGVWCSKVAMAADLELSSNSVRNAIKALLQMGLISEVGKRASEAGYTVEYCINLDVISGLERTRSRTPLDKFSTPTRPAQRAVRGEATPFTTCSAPLHHVQCPPAPREDKPLRTINNPPKAHEEVSDDFYSELLQVLRVTPKGWWAEKKGKAHVAKWFALGLTEAQILAVAKQNAKEHAVPPTGPLPLDDAMQAALGAKTLDEDAILAGWAEWLNGEGYVPVSAITPARARQLIELKLVSPDVLARRGILF